MAINVTCACGKKFSVGDEKAGKRGRCAACGKVLLIPTSISGIVSASNGTPEIVLSSRSQSRANDQNNVASIEATPPRTNSYGLPSRLTIVFLAGVSLLVITWLVVILVQSKQELAQATQTLPSSKTTDPETPTDAAPQQPPGEAGKTESDPKDPPPQQDSTTKSAHYHQLFAQLSDTYRLNGVAVQPDQLNAAAVLSFASDDPKITALAKDAMEMSILRKQLSVLTAAWRKAAMQPDDLRKYIIERIAEELPKDATEENRDSFADDIMTAIQLSGPSNARIEAARLLLLHLEKVQAEALPAAVESRYASEHAAASVSARIHLEPGRLPAEMIITNQGDSPLRHAIIWYRFEVDSPPGFSKEELDGLRKAYRLGGRKAVKTKVEDRAFQNHVTAMGSRNIIYVPLLEPGVELRVPYDLGAVRRCKVAKVNLVADGVRSVEQDIEGISEMQQKIQGMFKDQSTAGNENPSSPTGPGMAKSADASPDGLPGNSLWRGTTQFGNGTSQKVDVLITRRRGERFYGEMSYPGVRSKAIEGTVKDGTISWKVSLGNQHGIPHQGQIQDGRITVTFDGKDERGKATDGSMTLELVTGSR